MRILFPLQLDSKARLYSCALTLLLSALLLTISNHQSAYAADKPLNFDMQPLISDPLHPITKSYFVMEARPGTHQQNSIVFTNTGATSGTLKLYPVDAFTASTGGTAFDKNTDPRKDVGSWITLSKPQITLGPGQTQVVPFQVHIPYDARSGQHVGGIAAEDQGLQTLATAGKFHLTLHQRRVLAVQINLPSVPVENLVASNLLPDDASHDANHYQRLQIKLTNDGNMMIRPAGHLLVSNLQGRRLQYLTLHISTFLPQTSISYPAYIQHTALPIGRYRASLILTYGHHHTLSYTGIFTIKAKQKTISNAISTLVTLGDSQDALALLTPWQLAIAGIILLLLIGAITFWLYKAFLFLARSRHKNRKTEESKETVHAHVSAMQEGTHAGDKDNDAFHRSNPHSDPR